MSKKQLLFSISLVLMLTISAMMTSLPVANAAEIETYAFICASPDPVGVDQTVYVTAWLNLVPPTASGPQGDRWQNLKVLITKPDGETETKGPYTSDPVGLIYFQYQTTQVGTYYFQLSFPGQWINTTTYKRYYGPSTSKNQALTVQEEQLSWLIDTPLPTDYWTRPINAENREWWSISGGWLMSGSNYLAGAGKFNPYTTAPNSAHIIWTKELAFGGLAGGDLGTAGYYTGQSYESRLNPPIVMNGRIYYNTPDPPRYGFYCVDLRTGEELWFQNGTMPAVYMHNVVRWGAINLGQLYYYNSPNQHGVIPYLWSTTGSTWSLFDAFTGNWILNLENATTGLVSFTLSNTVFGPSGELLVYALDGNNNWLAMWNSSLAIPTANATSTGAWHWRPDDVPGREINWKNGIQWNQTVPDVPGAQSITKISDGVVYARVTLDTVPPVAVHVAYDATTGQQKWVQNRTGNLGLVTTYSGLGPMGEGVYTEYVKETLQWYGFDIDTGNQLWETDPYNTTDWAMYGAQATIAYGRLFTTSYDGYVHCYNLTNGQLMWKYSTENCGLETPYGNYPFFGAVTVADGKVFAAPGEHSPNHPLYRGEKLYVIDMETGKLIWNITGMYENYRDMGPTIADGYLVVLNGYDNRLYCFGKGQTATTVSASPEISVNGDSVLIKGTVTDQSPGAKDTPAIADEDMTAWMEYMYMQKQCPADVKGVEVTLDTLDPNGNFVHIGTVTSDASGMFKKMWTPEVPGEYTIIATFAGSESYWSSYAETAIGVDEAPLVTPPPEVEPSPPLDLYILLATIAMIIAIALAAVWIKRK